MDWWLELRFGQHSTPVEKEVCAVVRDGSHQRVPGTISTLIVDCLWFVECRKDHSAAAERDQRSKKQYKIRMHGCRKTKGSADINVTKLLTKFLQGLARNASCDLSKY